jgi:hypothetical protein
MFLFSHIGITVGSAILVSGVVFRFHNHPAQPFNDFSGIASTNAHAKSSRTVSELCGLNSLSKFLDIRFLMLGSILSDILDKPLSFLGLGDGRFIFHTLLVNLIVLFIGFFLTLKNRKTWVLAISIGMLAHLVLDFMWQNPHALFWPLDGWNFPPPVQIFFWGQIFLWWSTLVSDPTVLIFEGIGLAPLLFLTWILICQRSLISFLTRGKIANPTV